MKKLFLFAICLLIAVPGFSQKLQYGGFGVHGNLVFPEHHNTGFGVGASVNMGELSKGVYLVPNANFWTASWEIYDDGSSTDIAIAGDVRYYLDGRPQVAYFGGGLSFNFLSFSYDFKTVQWNGVTWVEHTETFDDSDTKIGFHPLAGYIFDVGGTQAFVEAKYLLISDWNTFMISVGALFGK